MAICGTYRTRDGGDGGGRGGRGFEGAFQPINISSPVEEACVIQLHYENRAFYNSN